MRACTALFLLFVFASRSEAPQSQILSFEEGVVKRSLFAKHPLPPPLLNRLSKVVEYALVSGAAREISQRDLFHAHLLFARGFEDLAKPNAILLHTQEMASWSAESFRKRNVLISGNSQLEILECSRGLNHRRFAAPADRPSICTVNDRDLGLINSADVYILLADKLPKAAVLQLAFNTRRIRGQKILFVGFGLTFRNGRLALP